jgi:glutathione S-transferase
MKIYDRQGTPNAARIRIVVAEKGLESQVEYVTVDLIAAAQKQPAFLKMNPIGKTPVLELEDGLCISESTAITEYLDNLDGNPTLTGETVDDYFHYGTPGLGAALRPWRMPDWAGKEEWGKRRGAQAVANLPYFDDVLKTRPFIAGELFSMADISLFAGIAFAAGAGLPIAPGLTALAAWRERVSQVPAVKNRSGQDLLPEDIERRKP